MFPFFEGWGNNIDQLSLLMQSENGPLWLRSTWLTTTIKWDNRSSTALQICPHSHVHVFRIAEIFARLPTRMVC